MYKSKLQVLCQQNSWSLPNYSITKDGPDHNPRFTATVTVNGVLFETTDQSRSSKEAQNVAAKLAFDRFSSPVPVPNPPQPLPVTGCPASMRDLNIKPSIGTTSQPIMTEIIPTPLLNETPLQIKDDKKFIDVRHAYKNLLQIYAQKRCLALPEYSCEREGPPHASRFKSKVTIDGKTYESPEFFSTLKEAEHAAAKVAWESFSVNEVQEADSGLYKNLLQELALRGGFYAPKYETKVSGPPHMPTFVSIVEVGERSFQGAAAKSKKQAEMNAAKVAYAGLQEQWQSRDEEGTGCSEPPVIRDPEWQSKDEEGTGCRELPVIRDPGRASLIPTVLPSGSQIKEALKVSSSILQSVIMGDLQESVSPKADLVVLEEQDEEYIGGNEEKFSSELTTLNAEVTGGNEEKFPSELTTLNAEVTGGNEEKFSSELTTLNADVTGNHAPGLTPEANINAKRYKCSPSSDYIYACLRDPFPLTSFPEDGTSSSSMHSESSISSSMDSNNEPPVGGDGTTTLPRETVLIYPRVPNMTFPDGATVLPFSDDKWVAVRMNSFQ